MLYPYFDKLYTFFLSESRRRLFERFIFLTAIVTFIIHFVWIILVGGMNPISAIYTPFSIILLYEIYLLIYYLPHSITIYLGKQYEIIALILLRKIFADLANLPIHSIAEDYSGMKHLLVSFGGLLVLLLLIFLFYKLSGNKPERVEESLCKDQKSKKFVFAKKVLAMGLLFLFIVLFAGSLYDLKDIASLGVNDVMDMIYKMNNVFFSTFFSALILTEVLLLLFTFNLSDKFSKVIRNSGFIISTILLKLSFQTEGLMSIAIILVAATFGVAVMAIHRLYESKL